MTLTGPATAHRQDLWPGLAIDRGAGLATWRGRRLTRLVPFAEIVPQGLPLIAVVGSGPSLASQHPERLPARSAILLNGAASLADRVPPLAVMVEDERFVFRHMAMVAALPREVPLMLSPAAMRAMAERDADTLRDRPVALVDNLAKPVNAARRSLSDQGLDAVLVRGEGTCLSTDPDRGVVIHGTVALSAVQVALAARPARIVLAGIDLGNADTAPRFYERPGQTAPSGIVAGLDRSLAGFALALTVARQRMIAMTCASPVSTLLRIDYPKDDVLDAKAPT